MIQNENDVNSDTHKDAEFEGEQKACNESRKSRNEIGFLASPHWLHNTNFHHENDGSNDDAGQCTFRDVEEVGREEQQRQDDQNTCETESLEKVV